MSTLNGLIGVKVEDVSHTVTTVVGLGVDISTRGDALNQDTLSIRLGQWQLDVYNPYRVTHKSGDTINPDELLGKVVQNAVVTSEEAILFFQDGACLTIDLRDESYRGPEALYLGGPGINEVW